jgi:hypothetical protein
MLDAQHLKTSADAAAASAWKAYNQFLRQMLTV